MKLKSHIRIVGLTAFHDIYFPKTIASRPERRFVFAAVMSQDIVVTFDT